MTSRKARNGERVAYSRRSGKRNDVLAKSANPSNAQLGDRDALYVAVRVMIDILRLWQAGVLA
jgi:hypothetical protein